MNSSRYSFRIRFSGSFPDALLAVKAALKNEGFGVLCEIDIQQKIKEKLGKDMEPYTILGACNPPLADEALKTETEIGLFLPCNIIVYQKNKSVFIAAIDVPTAMKVVQNPDLQPIAEKVNQKLTTALQSLPSD
ncbi:DUF302 domain-containing protein [Candidatus Gracilibacteria bacterium]|nr:DUF302 domain-containing protein [Candidatus Gracilibacteria bacterium]MCF7819562.1 DUF302 domain-containing protein [Candidatus Gracilibacteria bacterium]